MAAAGRLRAARLAAVQKQDPDTPAARDGLPPPQRYWAMAAIILATLPWPRGALRGRRPVG